MKQFVAGLVLLVSIQLQAQTLPVIQLNGQADKPFIFFVSGDGGSKGFTLSLANEIHRRGYTVALMDAHAYFWDKKTPEGTTAAIAAYVAKNFHPGKEQQWVMAGYSFGADVTPFVVNRLPDSLKSSLANVVLLSPSTSTDFEIHLSDMLGIGKKRSMSVVAEINRMESEEVMMLAGDEEAAFPVSGIKLPHFRHELLKGDHHFNSDYTAVADKICTSIAVH